MDDYESRGLPLDVFVLDMDWHMKNGWTGWTFDKQLFPYPEDTLGYLKSRGLLLAANLHDALGVGNWDRQYEPRMYSNTTQLTITLQAGFLMNCLRHSGEVYRRS